MRILFVKYAAIGDVLNATPAFDAVCRKFPEAEIDWLVGKWSAPVLENEKRVSERIVFDEGILSPKRLPELWRLALRLRRRRYDISICLHKSLSVHLLLRLVGARRRLGLVNHPLTGLLQHETVVEDPYSEARQHHIGYYNEVVARLGALPGLRMHFELLPPAGAAAEFIRHLAAKERVLIGICPGGAKNSLSAEGRKRWPLENYVELIRSNPDLEFVTFGAPFDKYASERFAKEGLLNVSDAIGLFPLWETAQVMRSCRVFVTHDTGLLHVASALGLPIVALFGPTSDKRHGPLGDNAAVLNLRLPCSPCYLPLQNGFAPCDHVRCLQELAPSRVAEEVRSLLAEAG